MRRMRRLTKGVTLLVAALALVLGASTVPASAAPPADVIVFQGYMETSPLWAPLLGPGGGLIEPDGTFWLSRGICVTVLEGTCTIDVSGLLTHELHHRSHPLPDGTVPHIDLLGPSCYAGQGYDGTGTLAMDGNLGSAFPAALYHLSNVGWITSAGGNVPITGTISEPSTGASGFLTAYAQLQGGPECFDPDPKYGGQPVFAIAGVAAIVLE